VRISTSDGVVGWGEGGQYGPSSPAACAVSDVLAPLLIGRTRFEPIAVWEELYARVRDFGRGGAFIEAISAVDIALWDIWGQRLGQPISALLGGVVRDRIPAYATGGYYSEDYAAADGISRAAMLDRLATEARSYVDAGFTMVKMKVGLLPIADDVDRVRTVRDAIGDRTHLMVDANHAYSVSSAVRMGRQLERHGVLWFEEPVVPEDRVGYRRLRDALDIAIAGGEAEMTRFGFRDLFVGECVDIAQPDLGVCGGLSEFLKIAALATAFGVPVIPHVWGSGVALAAALHAVAALPASPYTHAPVALQNEPAIEFDRKHNPLRDDLLQERLELRDGALDVPRGTGLGVTVNLDVVKRYGSSD
jgi:D-galactarolactone cycloisomerase